MRKFRSRVAVSVIRDEQGKNQISFEDHAIALVDELKKPGHEWASFMVGY